MSYYTIRPIEHWPTEPTPSSERRSKWTFKAKWSSTVDLLESELHHISAHSVVMQIDVQEKDIRIDGGLRANASPASPRVILSFESSVGSLSYPCDSCEFWQHNIRSIALALQALRAVDRYGVTSRAEQYRGWQSLPSNSGDMSVEEATAIMGAFANDYRKARRETHPDHGGSAESFSKVTQAAELLGIA